jgi:dynein heavy chain
MEGRAKEMIEGGSIRGHWIMLNNCHLLVNWLKQMEIIIENIQKPDKNFRLWLTTEPTDGFPLGILQKSLKVVTEPPDGLGANIRQIYSGLTQEVLESSERPEFRSLVYVLSFFHATIQERKKFGKIGWNIKYDFNKSDFTISFELIALYMNKAMADGDDELPWETLRYLIGEAMYGGRVTNDFDRRVMMCYLEEFCGDFIFDTNQQFYFSQAGHDYKVQAHDTLEQYMDAIEEIPLFTNPGVFGLHANAEIIYFTNYAKELWRNTLEMQTSDGGEAGGMNKEEYITSVATDIQSKLPELFDTYNIKKKFEVPTPT